MSNNHLITDYFPSKRNLPGGARRPSPTNLTSVRFEDNTLKVKSYVQVDSNSRISDLRISIIEKLQTICKETRQGKRATEAIF